MQPPNASAGLGATSPKLSKETLKMKFMQRNRDQEHIQDSVQTATLPQQSESKPEIYSPKAGMIVTNDNSKFLKWKISVCPVSFSESQSDCLKVVGLVSENTSMHVMARRSFGSFSSWIDRAREEVMSSEPGKKRSSRLEDTAISDREMANFYKNRVGNFSGDKSKHGKPSDAPAAKRKKDS